MSQGKAFTSEQKEQAIQSLQSYLELGFSRNKSCSLIGLAPATLSNWVKEDETLGMKLESWENAINKVAMANILDAINKEGENTEDSRKETTKWWLERKMKNEGFSLKLEQELSNPDGNLKTIIINKHEGNDRPIT